MPIRIELTYEEINELMQLATEYLASIFDEEKHKEVSGRLDEYDKKLNVPIFIFENAGEYPAIIVDEDNIWIDVSREISIRITKKGISVEVEEIRE
jgi:hypothetical protein